MSLKRIVAPAVLSGAVLVGGATAGMASAYASTPTTTVQSHTGNHPVAAWVHTHRRAIARAVVSVSAKTIGVTPQSLVSELRSGQSIASVATAHGVNVATVQNALVTAADAEVSKLVGEHKLTSTQASKIEAALPARIVKIVNRTF